MDGPSRKWKKQKYSDTKNATKEFFGYRVKGG
jgi:hypothetical protein